MIVVDFLKRFANRVETLLLPNAGTDRLFRLGDEIAKLEDERNNLYAAFGRATLSQDQPVLAERMVLRIAALDRLIADKNQQLVQINKKL